VLAELLFWLIISKNNHIMKKIILSLAVVAISMVSCNDASSDVQDQEVRAEAKKGNSNLSESEAKLRQKILDLTNKEFYVGMEGLSKEEIQKKAVHYLVEDCKSVLLENGFTEEYIKENLKNDEGKIVVEAMNYFNKSNNK